MLKPEITESIEKTKMNLKQKEGELFSIKYPLFSFKNSKRGFTKR